MTKEHDVIAVEYVLGLARGRERQAIEAMVDSDAGLRRSVERWQEAFASLHVTDGESLRTDSFQSVLGRIDSEGSHLPGWITQRADEACWVAIGEHVAYRVLREDPAAGRRAVLLRMQPGAVYQSHSHEIDEECLVIEGDLHFGDIGLRAGDFFVAPKGTVHPVSRTVNGCLLHVTCGLH
jgi:quercetin dioxygenase-like cupin family protein